MNRRLKTTTKIGLGLLAFSLIISRFITINSSANCFLMGFMLSLSVVYIVAGIIAEKHVKKEKN